MRLPINTREGWAAYYIKLFNKTGRKEAAHMAIWYLLLIESEHG